MRKKHLDAEQKAEELLMALGRELGESRVAFGEALMDEAKDDPPMFTVQTPPHVLLEEGTDMELAARSKKSSRKVRRALLLAAALVLVLGLVVVSSEGVKLKENNLDMEPKASESTRIVDESKAEFNVADFYLGYVPEGYELAEDTATGDYVRRIRYRNNEGDRILVHIMKTEQYGTYVDNENSENETVLVNDKEAHFFEMDGQIFLVWQMGDCTIDITSYASREDTLELAEHLFVK